jgi:hypothetical protein
MSSVNGGNASGGMMCVDPPKQTKDGIACDKDLKSNAVPCTTVNLACNSVGFE